MRSPFNVARRATPHIQVRSRIWKTVASIVAALASTRSGGTFDGNPLSSGTTALGTAIKLFHLGNAGLIARHAIVAQFQKRSHPHHVAPLAPGPGGFGPGWVNRVEGAHGRPTLSVRSTPNSDRKLKGLASVAKCITGREQLQQRCGCRGQLYSITSSAL